MIGRGRNAVAIGGGTGLPMVLRCLLQMGFETSAIVTMADDGGSSGHLRRELGILPPGDVRNCLVALAPEDSPLAALFQYRFGAGEGLQGHALGNLVIAALEDMEVDFPTAIDVAAEMLGSRGKVYPCTLEDVHLTAEDSGGKPLHGQARIARTLGPMAQVCLEPGSPKAYGPALDAIGEADVIVVGPGSLYTSLIPNFLVEGVAASVRESGAKSVYVCNLANQRGETAGMDAMAHVQAMIDHGLENVFDLVLVHDWDLADVAAEALQLCEDGTEIEPVFATAEIRERIASLGPKVSAHDLVDVGRPWRHDPDKLCARLSEVF